MSARKVLSALGATALVVAFGFLLAFVLINFMLGCETWDESLWTEYNSCITLGHIIEGIGGKQ
tara:strand:+ start:20836 stop:21024 length:189 start_codon:yes stop_codon:yes gene_type:complete